MIKYPVGICSKCGLIYGYNNTLTHTCYICGNELTLLEHIDWDIVCLESTKQQDKYRLEFQPKDSYDSLAWMHREHMEITREKVGINCPKGFSRKYQEGVVLPECPYCHGYYTGKIGAGNRMLSAGLFGLGSKKIGKQWHCYLCNSDF